MLNYNLVYKPHHGNNGEIFYLKPLRIEDKFFSYISIQNIVWNLWYVSYCTDYERRFLLCCFL